MYNIGRIHPLLKSYSANMQDVSRIPIRLKIVTGTYILQTHRAKYSNGTAVSPLCTLWHRADENLQHFVLSCDALQTTRALLLQNIITERSRVFDQIAHSIDLLQLIINPFGYISSKTENEITLAISKCLEPLCRHILYKLHNKRYELLEKMGKTKQKCRKT
jgi:hypothetical protein